MKMRANGMLNLIAGYGKEFLVRNELKFSQQKNLKAHPFPDSSPAFLKSAIRRIKSREKMRKTCFAPYRDQI